MKKLNFTILLAILTFWSANTLAAEVCNAMAITEKGGYGTGSKPTAAEAKKQAMSSCGLANPKDTCVVISVACQKQDKEADTKQASNNTGMKFVRIPAGSFQMGDLSGGGNSDEKPVHRVSIKAFYMGTTEVTQAQWQAVMGDNPSKFKGNNRPVEQVSWNDIQNFIEQLNQQTGKQHRLPSEAEWEYAARAGSTTKYSWGNYIDHNRANYGTDQCCSGLASGKDRWEYTAPVAQFTRNAWGLYDMHGNVWEWVEDCWNGDYNGAPSDGSAWESGDCAERVLRGGSWNDNPTWLRSAIRDRHTAFYRYYSLGFRLVQDRNP